MKIFCYFLTLLAVWLFLPDALFADEIHMVNGDIYSVKSWKFDGDFLLMELQDGKTLKVYREKVKKISIDQLENDPDVVRIEYDSSPNSTRITYSESRDLALPESVLAQMNSGNYAAALEAMEATAPDYKNTVDYDLLKGTLLLAAGQFAEANSVVSAAIRENSSFPGSKYTLAMSAYFLGHIQEATRIIEDISTSEVPASSRDKVINTYRELELLKNFKPVSSLNLTVLVDNVVDYDQRIETGIARMEESFDTLSKILVYVPPQPVLVIVSDHQRFSHGQNLGSFDGKVVVPASVLGTSKAKEIITHELSHSFLLSKSRGNCPRWLHEGLAQALSGRSIDDNAEPFIIFLNSGQKMNIYDDSLATLEYILNSYGMESINRLLSELEAGSHYLEAVNFVFKKSYPEILTDRNHWLQDKLIK